MTHFSTHRAHYSQINPDKFRKSYRNLHEEPKLLPNFIRNPYDIIQYNHKNTLPINVIKKKLCMKFP